MLLEVLGPTDVQSGAAVTGSVDNSGWRDLIMYQQAIKPRIYITTGSRGAGDRRCRSMPAVWSSWT